MNPADENTREELKRVEEKIVRVKLEKLREVVAAGDSTAMRGQVAQIGTSFRRAGSLVAILGLAAGPGGARCQELIPAAPRNCGRTTPGSEAEIARRRNS